MVPISGIGEIIAVHVIVVPFELHRQLIRQRRNEVLLNSVTVSNNQIFTLPEDFTSYSGFDHVNVNELFQFE